MNTELKLPFGLRDDHLMHVSDVKRGLACDCICPSCKHPLVARKGKIITHHFAHYKSSECEHAVETALHLAAKDLLEKTKQIYLPPVTCRIQAQIGNWVICKAQTIQFDEVRLEHYLDKIRPDVLVYVNGVPLMIEIVVTHPIDSPKLNRIKALDISTLQISLSSYPRSFTLEDLKQVVIYGTNRKTWIYNRHIEKYRNYVLQTLAEEIPVETDTRLVRKVDPKALRYGRYQWQYGKEFTYSQTQETWTFIRCPSQNYRRINLYREPCLGCQFLIALNPKFDDSIGEDNGIESVICTGKTRVNSYQTLMSYLQSQKS